MLSAKATLIITLFQFPDENQSVLAEGKVKDVPVAVKVLAAILEKGK